MTLRWVPIPSTQRIEDRRRGLDRTHPDSISYASESCERFAPRRPVAQAGSRLQWWSDVESKAMSANSDNYRTAVAGFDAVIENVSDGQWTSEAPCEGWTAAHVVGHVIGGMRVVAGGSWDGTDLERAGDDPKASYAAARDAALANLTEDALADVKPGPAGDMTLDAMLGMFLTNDILIHTWDLATATGQQVVLDPALVESAHAALVAAGDFVRAPNIFGPAVEPPVGADAQTKLLCFAGRRAG